MQPFLASQQSVRIYDVRTRTVPIPHLTITGTDQGSAQSVFLVPDLCEVAILDRLVVSNRSVSAVALSLYTLPPDTAISTASLELDAYSIPANSVVRIDEILGAAYAKGAECLVFADTAGALSLRGKMTQER